VTLSAAQIGIIAIHEAAHAVVALRLGVDVRGVEVGERSDGSLGFVEAPSHPNGACEAMVCIAGVIGQSIDEGRRLTFAEAAAAYAFCGGEHDLPAARRLVAEADLERLWSEARDLLLADWTAVEALAAELVVAGAVSGARLRELVPTYGAEEPSWLSGNAERRRAL